ncbi:hypothetical protein QOT17_019381 [Balamuthia mandrillaris]
MAANIDFTIRSWADFATQGYSAPQGAPDVQNRLQQNPKFYVANYTVVIAAIVLLTRFRWNFSFFPSISFSLLLYCFSFSLLFLPFFPRCCVLIFWLFSYFYTELFATILIVGITAGILFFLKDQTLQLGGVVITPTMQIGALVVGTNLSALASLVLPFSFLFTILLAALPAWYSLLVVLSLIFIIQRLCWLSTLPIASSHCYIPHSLVLWYVWAML